MRNGACFVAFTFEGSWPRMSARLILFVAVSHKLYDNPTLSSPNHPLASPSSYSLSSTVSISPPTHARSSFLSYPTLLYTTAATIIDTTATVSRVDIHASATRIEIHASTGGIDVAAATR